MSKYSNSADLEAAIRATAKGTEIGQAVSFTSTPAGMIPDSAPAPLDKMPRLDWDPCTPTASGAMFETDHGLKAVQGKTSVPLHAGSRCDDQQGR